MKKKLVALVLACVCLVSFALGAAADDFIKKISAELRPDFTIKVDGEIREFKNKSGDIVYPILYDGTTYLPLRAIGELMGKTVYWYENDKRIELKDSTVTDADVIVDGLEKTNNAEKDKTKFIGEDKAKKIALKNADFKEDDVKFIKAELDEDDGIYYYDIEFVAGDVEFDVEIGAVNGAILGWETDKEFGWKFEGYDTTKSPSHIYDRLYNEDIISEAEAKEIALKKAELKAEDVVFKDFELDSDDAVPHYDMEFKKDGIKYEADINAVTGEIIKWEIDKK